MPRVWARMGRTEGRVKNVPALRTHCSLVLACGRLPSHRPSVSANRVGLALLFLLTCACLLTAVREEDMRRGRQRRLCLTNVRVDTHQRKLRGLGLVVGSMQRGMGKEKDTWRNPLFSLFLRPAQGLLRTHAGQGTKNRTIKFLHQDPAGGRGGGKEKKAGGRKALQSHHFVPSLPCRRREPTSVRF